MTEAMVRGFEVAGGGLTFKLDLFELPFMLAAAPKVTGYWFARAAMRVMQGYKRDVQKAHKRSIAKVLRKATRFDGWPKSQDPTSEMLNGPVDAWRRVHYQYFTNSSVVLALATGAVIRPKRGKWLKIPAEQLRIGKRIGKFMGPLPMAKTGKSGANEFVLQGRKGAVLVQRMPDGTLYVRALLMKQVVLPQKIYFGRVWEQLAPKRDLYVREAADQVQLFIAGKKGKSGAVNALLGGGRGGQIQKVSVA